MLLSVVLVLLEESERFENTLFSEFNVEQGNWISLQIYRPQTKFAKVMFSHLFVSHSVHRGGGWYPSMHCSRSRGMVSQHALQISRPTPTGEVEGSGLGGLQGPHPGGLQAHIQGGLQAHTWGGGLQAHTQGISRPTPRRVSRPTPRWAGVSQHALRQTPPPWLLLWVIRILLECILVAFVNFSLVRCPYCLDAVMNSLFDYG